MEDSSLHLVVFWEISIKQAVDMGPLINAYVQNGVLVFGVYNNLLAYRQGDGGS